MLIKRAYDNRNRELKRQETREKIIQTMASLLASGQDDLPVSELAKQAGVSRRSVYQHFPDKQARIRAISEWVDANVRAGVTLPESYADIPHYIEARVDYILDNQTLVRAQMASGVSKDVRSYRKLVHARHLRNALGEQLTDTKDIESFVALIISLVRAEAIFDLRDIYKMSRRRIKEQLSGLFRLALSESRSNASTST